MCTLFLLPYAKQNKAIQWFMVLMLCGTGYLFGDMFPSAQRIPNDIISWLEFIAGNALPGVFWLSSLTIFQERFTIKPWHYLIASSTLIIPLVFTISQIGLSFSTLDFPHLATTVKYTAMLIELILLIYALYIAVTQWRDDLVQQRRYYRGNVITLAACYIGYVIISEQVFHWHWQYIDLLKYLLLSVLMLSINLLLFHLRENNLFSVNLKLNPQINVENPVKLKELAAIKHSMEQEKLYREDGLTIAKLSKHLAIHEYKLRNLINGELAYRNFNDFLNFYRIKEVSEKLAQVEYAQTPILTLALESGFRSLSSFNKAFKEKHQVTPSAFRKSALANYKIN